MLRSAYPVSPQISGRKLRGFSRCLRTWWESEGQKTPRISFERVSREGVEMVYSSMALFQIEPELDSTGGLDVAMFAQGADEFITGSSATVFAFCPVPASAAA